VTTSQAIVTDDVSDDSDQLNITSSDFEGGTTVLIPLEGTVTQFADVSEAAGFQQNDLNNGTSGSSWADVDSDGDMDLFLPNQWSYNNLYINDGDGTFTEVTSDPVVDEITSYSNGNSWADYDDDDDMDLFVTTVWGDNNVNYLYTNDGDGTFTKVTSGDIVNTQHMSWGGVWGDYDGDNDLDIIVTGHESNSNEAIYTNNGDGTFTTLSGSDVVSNGIPSKNVNWVDYDNDDDFDVYLSNWGINKLFRNDNGSFSDVTNTYNVYSDSLSNGAAWGDFNNDGRLDLWAANIRNRDDIYLNDGEMEWTNNYSPELPLKTQGYNY
jgi:hypothetical protein